MGEPLETGSLGFTEGRKQSLDVAPAVRTQHALRLKCSLWANTLVVVPSSQIKAATSDRFDPLFILECHILTVTSDQRFYKLPQSLRF